MLRRVENVSLWLDRGFWGLFTGNGRMVLQIGKKRVIAQNKTHKTTFADMCDRSHTYPVGFMGVGERRYWRFENRWYWDNEDLNAQQVYALLVTRDQRRKATINRAQSFVAMDQEPPTSVRGSIPEDVKQFVWKRDGGQCRQCRSNTELQFDHIIPASMGGASTPENIQVLCGPCNRRKGASVASPGATKPARAEKRSSRPTEPLPPAPAAGWYKDPWGIGQRYWNGGNWTTDTSG